MYKEPWIGKAIVAGGIIILLLAAVNYIMENSFDFELLIIGLSIVFIGFLVNYLKKRKR
jgi:type III secretory pathway component EscS